jgi:hypothetical protein
MALQQHCLFKAATGSTEGDAAGSAQGAAPGIFIKKEQLDEQFLPPGVSAAGSAEGAAPGLPAAGSAEGAAPGLSADGSAEGVSADGSADGADAGAAAAVVKWMQQEGAAAGAAQVPFCADKIRYNKFNYKLKMAPESMKNTWKVIRSQEKLNPAGFFKFVDEVINLAAIDKTGTKRTISKVDEIVEDSEWMAWHEAEQKEGYDCLLAQVKAGTILARRHARLPADSEIPWPKNQQVRYITERERKTSGTGELQENNLEYQTQEAASDFDTAFEATHTYIRTYVHTLQTHTYVHTYIRTFACVAMEDPLSVARNSLAASVCFP